MDAEGTPALHDRDLLLRFLGQESRCLGELRPAEWLSLCASLKHHGVLGPYAATLLERAPSFAAGVIEADRARRAAWARDRLELLAPFAELARKERLRYVLIKGMAASKELYGDVASRDSGDIDVLVHPDDVPKADYVARRAGWIQPAEAYLVRRTCNECGNVTDEALEAMESPYALRSNEFLPHVTNYYRAGQHGGIESLEIHDSFHLIGQRSVGDLLWLSKTADLGGFDVPVPSAALGMVISSLSLHDDAEGVRSNTVTRGDMGLKACVDLHHWLGATRGSQVPGEVRSIAGALGVARQLGIAYHDVAEVFPDDAEALGGIVALAPSAWSLPYIERAFDARARAEAGAGLAIARVRALLTGHREFAADGEERRLPTSRGIGASPFSIAASARDGGVCARWSAPTTSGCFPEGLVFQCVALASTPAGTIARRVNVFHEHGRGWTSDLTDVSAGTVATNANRLVHGSAAPVAFGESPGGGFSVSCDVPLLAGSSEVAAVLSVHDQICGQLYRRCAGYDFVELAEAAVDHGGRGPSGRFEPGGFESVDRDAKRGLTGDALSVLGEGNE